MNEYYALMDSNKVKLAAAYAVFGACGESVLLRAFEDILHITYIIKIAEELIRDEKESDEKKEILEKIEWHKTRIINSLHEKAAFYASILTLKRAKAGENEQFYKKVMDMIDREQEYDFYDWVFEINKIE